MLKKWTTAALMTTFLASAAAAQDAKTVIDNATKALGYGQLNAIEYSGSGFEGTGMGQAQSPTAGWPKFTVKSFTRFIDYTAGTSQGTMTRSRPADPKTGLLPGGGGLDATPEGQAALNVPAAGTWAQRLDVNLSPPMFLKLAAANIAKATVRRANGRNIVSFDVDAKPQNVETFYRLTGYFTNDNMLEKVETAVDGQDLIGDMLVEQTFSGYKDFNGVKFPTRIVQTRAGLSWTDLTITDVKPNAPAPPPPAAGAGGRGGPGGAGDGARGAAAGAAPGGGQGGGPGAGQRGGPGAGGGGGRGAAAAPGNRKLGEGLFLITGGYRTIAAEFKDYIVLIDAPQNQAATSAIIAEAKRVIPNKPIRYVITTHAHFDHVGGLRAAAAEGATIIAHEMDKPLYEKWFSNPRTLFPPDALSKSGKRPSFEYMGDRKTLKDDTRTIEMYHIRGALHSEDMIVVYFPKEKIVFEADAFNAPAANAAPPANPGAQIAFQRRFASELDRLKIDYTHIVPAHQPAGGDRDVTKEDLFRNIGRTN